MTYTDQLDRELIHPTDVICDECEGAILESEKRHRGRHVGEIVCGACERDLAAEERALFPTDEPVDEGLAHLDRLDGWHGPHHG